MSYKFYIASTINNKAKVQEVFADLIKRGHTVADWTLTDDVPEDARAQTSEHVASLARRDHDEITECDVFVILSEPSMGRSMYVELGIALALHELRGWPMVFVVGPTNTESIFYLHPSVNRVSDMNAVIEWSKQSLTHGPSSQAQEGRLEEFKALRAEMLQLINDRIWGQATFSVLAAALLAFAINSTVKIPALVFMIGLALPFIFHTISREHARMRMGNYIRAVLEPRIPGMHWEEFLGEWRSRYGNRKNEGWLTRGDRAKHIFALSGLYLMVSVFSFYLLVRSTTAWPPIALGSALLLALLVMYLVFFRLYGKTQKEYQEIQKHWPVS